MMPSIAGDVVSYLVDRCVPSRGCIAVSEADCAAPAAQRGRQPNIAIPLMILTMCNLFMLLLTAINDTTTSADKII